MTFCRAWMKVTDHLLAQQTATGVQLLWATQNLFTHPRYANGAATNPDVHAFCCAAAQVQKVMVRAYVRMCLSRSLVSP